MDGRVCELEWCRSNPVRLEWNNSGTTGLAKNLMQSYSIGAELKLNCTEYYPILEHWAGHNGMKVKLHGILSHPETLGRTQRNESEIVRNIIPS